MAIPTLTPVAPFPTRRNPPTTYQAAVKASMDQLSTMTTELNSGVIPGINAASEAAVDSAAAAAADAALITSKVTEAATSATSAASSATTATTKADESSTSATNAANSATAAAGSATSAANSATSAAASAAAAVAITGLPSPTGHEGEVLSVSSGAMAWAKRDRAVPLAEGTVTAGACDYATGYIFSATISGATTISLTNVPATGTAMLMLRLTNGGSATVTWPSGIKWPGGTAPTLTASGLDDIVLMRTNSGVWSGAVRKDVK